MKSTIVVIKLWIVILLMVMTPSLQAQTHTLKIWPKGMPNSIPHKDYIETDDSCGKMPCWSKVSSPELQVFLPKGNNSTGTAVVIFPGGGYGIIAFEVEGTKIAEALTAQGIAAIVVKYRLPSDLIMKDKSIGPLQDAQEAVRLVRRNAAAWQINPDKIGVMGFSAGGHLAASVSTRFDEKVYQPVDATSARPNFSMLIYPVISFQDKVTHLGSRENLIGKNPGQEKIDLYSNELQITSNTPPAFLIHSADDSVVSPENSILYFKNLRAKNVDAELHIFQRGGHGFGLGNKDSTEHAWMTLGIEWLKSHGW